MAEICFAVEASRSFGLGHLMRCRTLASELARRGCTFTVALRGDPSFMDAWRWPALSELISLPESAEDAAREVFSLVRQRRPAWTVIDGYGLLATSLLAELYREGDRTLVLDDLAERSLAATIVLNPGALDASPYRTLAPGAKLLVGPDYALVADEHRAARRLLEEPAEARRVLIAFGGSDLAGMVPRLLAMLPRIAPELERLDVVLGPFTAMASVPRSPAVCYHHAPASLAPLIAEAHIVISSAGNSAWEVCCVGRPLLALQTADNQRHVLRTLAERDVALTLDCSEARGIREEDFIALWRRLREPDLRGRMAAAARNLVDGLGALRVATELGQ